MGSNVVSTWSADWVWSLPLIAATVTIHCFGLGLIYHRATLVLSGKRKIRVRYGILSLYIGAVALFTAILHGIEAGIWGAAYLLLGALPDRRTAMLYSLGAMTTYGKADVHLDLRWELMGPLEALDGWILFGLTTAFLLGIIQNIWRASNLETQKAESADGSWRGESSIRSNPTKDQSELQVESRRKTK
jgi:hypothetical protein